AAAVRWLLNDCVACPTGGRGLSRFGHMTSHDHQLQEGDSLTAAARDALTRQGEQWTDMRAAVFEALAGFDKPASAYDIAEAVSKSQDRRVAAHSGYRILDLFVGGNLARRHQSADADGANR